MRFVCPLLLLVFSLSSCQTSPPPQTPTPEFPALTAFKKVVEDRLGVLWDARVKANVANVQLGTVKVTFEIPVAGGAVRNVRLVSNTAGPLDKAIAEHAIADLRTPPVPKAVLKKLGEGEPLIFDESFTIFSNP